eukprot:COSAG01_NODE_2663_length_7293_cov_5.946483_6_plen_120_part_00
MKPAAGRIKKVYYGLPMLSTDSALPQTARKATATSRMAVTVQSGGADPRDREATGETPPLGASTAVSWRWRGGEGAKESRLDRRHGTSPRGLLPGGHDRVRQTWASRDKLTPFVRKIWK